MWGVVPVSSFFFLFLGFATAVFLFQEMVPIVRHVRVRGCCGRANKAHPELTRRQGAGYPCRGEKPDVFILDDDEFVLFSVTGRRPAVFLSSGLVRALTVEQLRAAIPTIGHIRRSRRPLACRCFSLRGTHVFFNPVALMEFRRIVQEEENICDDVAVAMTGNRTAPAEVLEKFYYTDDEENLVPMQDAPGLRGPARRVQPNHAHREPHLALGSGPCKAGRAPASRILF